MRLLQMSIAAGILIAVIVILRCIGRRLLSARFLFLLWFVALARMVLPVELPVKLPGMGLEASWAGEGQSDPGFAWMEGENVQSPAAFDAGSGLSYSRLAVWIWADVCLGLLIFFTWSYIRQARWLNEAIPLGEAIPGHSTRQEVRYLVHDRIISPVTCGILHPRIIFPKNMDFKNTRSVEHILRHEYVHIRRFDNLWKVVMLAAVCVHWFNPLAWVMWVCFNRDMELACDECAVKGMDPDGRRAYAMTLLWFAEKNHKASVLCNGFGKSAVKERIILLMKNNKRTRTGIVCSVLVFAMSMTVFASVGGSPSGSGADAGKSPAEVLSEAPQFGEYEALGLRYDQGRDWIGYDSRIVGYFIDEYADGSFNKMEDLAGDLCLKAVRDENGKLDHFTEVEKTADLKQASEAEKRMAIERAYIREYGAYGLGYDAQTGYLAYNGHLVEAIQDTAGCGIYVAGAVRKEGDTVGLVIGRDANGTITDIKEVSPEEMSERLNQSMGMYRTEDGWRGDGNPGQKE